MGKLTAEQGFRKGHGLKQDLRRKKNERMEKTDRQA